MWHSEPAEVREYYAQLAEEEKLNHHILYPDYHPSPRKSSEIKRRNGSSNATTSGNHTAANMAPTQPLFNPDDPVIDAFLQQAASEFVEAMASAEGGFAGDGISFT